MVAQTNPLKLLAFALCAGVMTSAALADQTVELKRDIEASGPALTLGDVFVDPGPVGARAVAPAPRPGESRMVSARFIAAAAAAAGLNWTPPQGVDQIVVSGRARANTPAGAGRSQYAALSASNQQLSQSNTPPAPDAVVRRGDLITLVYIAPGLQLTTRGKALSDGAVGDPVRIVNLQSNHVVDATITGPGAASAGPGGSF